MKTKSKRSVLLLLKVEIVFNFMIVVSRICSKAVVVGWDENNEFVYMWKESYLFQQRKEQCLWEKKKKLGKKMV